MNQRRLSIALFALLVLVAGAITFWPRAEHADDSAREPFTWEAFLPSRPATLDPADWAEIRTRDALEVFEHLRERLIANEITAAAEPTFLGFVHDPARTSTIEQLFAQLDTPQRRTAIRELYAELMRAPSDPDVLLAKLGNRIAKAFRQADENPDDDGRRLGWAVSVMCYAALMAYDRCGDERFVELAADALQRALARRDSAIGRVDEVRRRVMHSWGGTRYDDHGRYSTNITLGGRVSFVLCLFAETVRNHASLQNRYAETAEEFISAARLCMDDYAGELVLTESGEAGYYIRPTHDDIEPLNHMAWAGNALILLGELTGEARYTRQAEQLARYFRSAMRVDDDGCLYWNYQPQRDDPFGDKTEWVWKARTTSQFVIFAWQHDIVFTSEDLQHLANTILTHVFRSDGRMSARIDSSFHSMEEFADFRGNYLSVTPFIVLEQIDPRVRQRIEQLVATRPDIGGWMRSGHGVVAYAWRLEPTQPQQ